MNPLGQFIRGKSRESSGEGRFAGDIADRVPAAESPEGWLGFEGDKEGSGGRKLINALGNERMNEPNAGTRRTSIAHPLVRLEKGLKINERDHLAELLIERCERA